MGKFVRFLKRSLGQDPFALLLGPYVDSLYRAAYRFTGRVEDAEDLVQSLLLRLYSKREELARVKDLRPWLVRALYNLFVDTVRRNGREPAADATGEEAISQLHGPGPEPVETAARAQLEAQIAAALERLNVEQRVVVTLHDMEGYNLAEISQVLDLPIGTVKSRLHRARARLRECLRRELFCVTQRVSKQG
ncbi:MAG TPA: RNA polymerase sigma factor [Burkholderiales bacterium]|jgi:RNA polymerase sigma factor (sigma-70 family)|nr:RNA polymerase sigma factor [Burkholderiales bacterium]